jgi:hypothetical protein
VQRLISCTVLALSLLLGVAQQHAWAQSAPYSPYVQPNYNPYSRPVVSPYLNIIRGNNTPAINYFTGTIPERQNRAQFNQFNSEIQNLERRSATPVAPQGEEPLIPSLPETGHPATFLNLNPFYGYGAGFNPGTQAFGQANRPGARPSTPRR